MGCSNASSRIGGSGDDSREMGVVATTEGTALHGQRKMAANNGRCGINHRHTKEQWGAEKRGAEGG
jgi:hypothetical protein